MNSLLKGTIKFAIGTCVTLGVVTVVGSAEAASAIGKVLFAGTKAAKEAMKEEIVTLNAKKENVDTVSDAEMTMDAVEC